MTSYFSDIHYKTSIILFCFFISCVLLDKIFIGLDSDTSMHYLFYSHTVHPLFQDLKVSNALFTLLKRNEKSII